MKVYFSISFFLFLSLGLTLLEGVEGQKQRGKQGEEKREEEREKKKYDMMDAKGVKMI